jgi:ABC-type nitrate/sulfonate/bicarbonate transport system permease component
MDRQIHKSALGVVAPLTREVVASLQGYDIVEFVADELSATNLALNKVKLLIVGGDCQPLKSVLPALRAAVPNLAVVAHSGSLDRASLNFYRNHVDGLYDLPKDVDSMIMTVESGAAELSSGWKLFLAERLGNGALALIVLLGLWWLAVALFQPAPYLLPAPTGVASAFAAQSGQFLFHLSVTAYEAFLGFVIGNTLGILLAISLHRYVKLQKFTMPVLISFQAIPIVALAPLLVVWLGTGLISKVAMAAIICFFPMVVNGLQAFSSIDRDYVELFEFYRADFAAKLKMLLLPASFPAIVSALKISAGLAVVGAIVAELTGADKGLGYILLNASYRLETDMMFVAMLLSGALGMAFFQMPALLRFVVPQSWRVSLT